MLLLCYNKVFYAYETYIIKTYEKQNLSVTKSYLKLGKKKKKDYFENNKIKRNIGPVNTEILLKQNLFPFSYNSLLSVFIVPTSDIYGS